MLSRRQVPHSKTLRTLERLTPEAHGVMMCSPDRAIALRNAGRMAAVRDAEMAYPHAGVRRRVKTLKEIQITGQVRGKRGRQGTLSEL